MIRSGRSVARRPGWESVRLPGRDRRALRVGPSDRVATMFIWGSHDPYLSAKHALPSIDAIASASLHELPGGHGPWLVNRECTSELIRGHLTRGGEPAVRPPEFSVLR